MLQGDDHKMQERDTFLFCLLLISLLPFAPLAAREIGSFDWVDPEDRFQYNHTLAQILVEFSSVVYINDLDSLIAWNCSRCDGLTKGFVLVELIVDVQHCLQAFVGVAENLNAIVIAFRGTQENSVQNWMEDLYFKQLDLNYPGVTGAMVHRGFYTAYHNTTLRQSVVAAVMSLKEKHEFSVMVTGHSMGGAMAAFCALDLTVNYDLKDIQVVTFGQPRIGNSIFAAYYSALLPNTYRMTHAHDIVPHLPPYYSLFPRRTYHHFGREIWIYQVRLGSLNYEAVRICDGSGEDPTCSRSVYGNSVEDHLCYMGVFLEADTQASCAFILRSTTIEVSDGRIIFETPFSS